jgi:hypothetical protein
MGKIVNSFDDEDLNSQPRKVKVEITVTRDEAGTYFKTKHVVKVDLPVTKKIGVAFFDAEKGFEVEPLCRDSTQMELPVADGDGKVTPITRAVQNH